MAQLAAELGPSSSEREHSDTIEAYVRSATNLTKQLLGLARGGKYETKPIDIGELLPATATMFGQTRKQIRISTAIASAPLVVDADKRQIEPVLLTLCMNA